MKATEEGFVFPVLVVLGRRLQVHGRLMGTFALIVVIAVIRIPRRWFMVVVTVVVPFTFHPSWRGSIPSRRGFFLGQNLGDVGGGQPAQPPLSFLLIRLAFSLPHHICSDVKRGMWGAFARTRNVEVKMRRYSKSNVCGGKIVGFQKF